MDQIKELDTHLRWKHKGGVIFTLLGYGYWKGGVNDPGTDDLDVIAAKSHSDSIANYDVVPAHYTVGGTDVRSADSGVLNTTQVLQHGDAVVVYYQPEDPNGVNVMRYEDFMADFVKVDMEGHELNAPRADAPQIERPTPIDGAGY